MSSGGCIIFEDADVVAIIATGLFWSLALYRKNNNYLNKVKPLGNNTSIPDSCMKGYVVFSTYSL